MSMYRQLWLSIFVSMLVALLAAQFASLVSARAYLEAQLTMKNRDNATALALALSQGQTDSGQMVTAAKALFDSGYYELVQVADPQGKSLLELVSTDPEVGAPRWFVRLLPIQASPGQAQISNGWQQLGSITLLSRSSFAYRELWQGAWSIAAIMLAGATLGGILGSLVLGRIRKPMQAVIEQAQAITEHRFVRIEEPKVPELRQLARAMNDTVGLLRERFEEDAGRIELLRQQANYEALTGLARRRFFLANLEEALAGEDAREGSLIVARIFDLGQVNRNYGREATDELLKRLGTAILALAERFPAVVASRINGADFAMLLPQDFEPGQFAEVLLTEMSRAAEPCSELCIFVAHARFVPGEESAALLARVDETLVAIEADGVNACRAARPASGLPSPVTALQWRSALLRALAEPGWRRLLAHPLLMSGDAGRYLECPLSIRTELDGEWQPASRFMPVAERLGLSADLDLAAVGLALAMLREQAELTGLWLHLSGQSLADAGFRRALIDRLQATESLAGRIWLEVPEAAAMRRVDSLRDWVAGLKPLGCKLGLAHCGFRFDRIGQLYDLGLDFLKVDASFVHGIGERPGNRAFLAGFCDIAHRIGVKVIAEGVAGDADLAVVRELGFDGMTGMGVHAG